MQQPLVGACRKQEEEQWWCSHGAAAAEKGRPGAAPGAAGQQGPAAGAHQVRRRLRREGRLAAQPIAPRDAAAIRSAEDSLLGVQVPQESGGGFSAAAFMESAAQYNEAVGAVRPGQASDAAAKHGINVTQDAVPGGRIVTEFVAGQVCRALMR